MNEAEWEEFQPQSMNQNTNKIMTMPIQFEHKPEYKTERNGRQKQKISQMGVTA